MRGLTLLILLATACNKPAPLPDTHPTDDDTGPFGLFPGEVGALSRYDEPISWRYSLGGGLASIGRLPSIVAEFHEFNRTQPEPISLPPAILVPPRTMRRILVEPAAFVAPMPNPRWRADSKGEYLVMDNRDPGGRPEENADLPLSVDRTGVYRMWIRYQGNANGIILTALDLLRKGHEADGPLLHEEINDYPTPAPAWTSFLVPLRAGEYILRLRPAPIVHTGVSVGGARRPVSWHGWTLAGNSRRVGSIYLTDELWKDAPDPPTLADIKHSQIHPNPSEWIRKVSLDDPEKWRQWQIRPIPRDLADRFPDLFQRSLAFWKQRTAALIAPEAAQLRPLPESAGLPAFDTIEHAQALFQNRDHFDFRSPQRQPIFDDEWNMIGSPAQIARRRRTLLDRVIDQPGPPFVWYSAFELLGGRQMPLNRWKNAHWWWGDYDVDGTLSGQYLDDVTPFEVAVPISKPGTYRFSVEVLDPPNRRLTGAMHFEVWALSDGKPRIARGDYACPMGRGGLQWVDLDPPLAVGDASTVTLKISRIDSATIARQCPGTGFTYRGFHGIRATAAPTAPAERPATISVEDYRNHAAPAWMPEGARYFAWFATNPHQESVYKEPLSQDFWDGASWPLPFGNQNAVQIALARDSTGTAQIGLRNRTKEPVRLDVEVGALKDARGTEFKDRIQWRVIAFAPDQPGWWRDDRTRFSPFALLRRPFVTVPPYNVAGLWLTIDGHGLPPGDYTATVTTIDGGAKQALEMRVHVSTVAIAPERPFLIAGGPAPREGAAYVDAFHQYGINVNSPSLTGLPGLMSKSEMERRHIRFQQIPLEPGVTALDIQTAARRKGLSPADFAVTVMDEPLRARWCEADRIAAEIHRADRTIQLIYTACDGVDGGIFTGGALAADGSCGAGGLADHANIWQVHESPWLANHWIPKFGDRPWMTYWPPVDRDKNPETPQGIFSRIRRVPGLAWDRALTPLPDAASLDHFEGTLLFALYNPLSEPWDTAYESIPDNSAMILPGLGGPVSTRAFEAVRSGRQEGYLAQMVKESIQKAGKGVSASEGRLIRYGGTRCLLRRLEGNPCPAP